MRLSSLCFATVISLSLVGCSSISHNDSNCSDESSVPKSSARVFLKEELEEKYGMEFEIMGGSIGMMSIAEDCDVRCVEDGIEFQATLRTKDYYEVVSENYLRHKYLPQVQEEIEAYLETYLSDFKFIEITADEKELPFNTSPNLTYEELKQQTYFVCDVYISDDRIFDKEELTLLFEKFSSNTTSSANETDNTTGYYRNEINMKVKFYVYTVPQKVYDGMQYCMKWYEGSFAGEEILIN